MGKITINQDKCKGCLLCISFCPKGMIVVSDNLNKRGVKTAKFKVSDECLGCAMCALICPDCCITVYKQRLEVTCTVDRAPFTVMDAQELQFDFERLEVYQLALDFLDFIFTISKDFPKDLKYSLCDNLKRAGISISNNIAEGSGKKSGKEKARFQGTALDSTRECINMFIILDRQKVINKEDYRKARSYGKRLTSMLFKLIASVGLIR